MITATEVLANAMSLSEKDRADLAHHLLLSLEPGGVGDDEIAPAWQQEIAARLAKIATGNFVAHDWRQSVDEVRHELKKDKQP